MTQQSEVIDSLVGLDSIFSFFSEVSHNDLWRTFKSRSPHFVKSTLICFHSLSHSFIISIRISNWFYHPSIHLSIQVSSADHTLSSHIGLLSCPPPFHSLPAAREIFLKQFSYETSPENSSVAFS